MENQLRVRNEAHLISIEDAPGPSPFVEIIDREKYLDSNHQVFMRRPVKTPCGHIFDELLLLAWLRRNPSCPMDRKPITKAQLVLDTQLQKEISDYLAANPSEDDSADYQELIEKFVERKGILKYFSLQTIRKKFSEHNWKATLCRVHRVAVICLIVSASGFLLTAFIGNGNTEASSFGVFKNGCFYVACGTGGLAIITSEPVQKLRDRPSSPPDSNDV